jgi:hypothetical protein
MDICTHLARWIRGPNHFRQSARKSLQVLDEVSVPTQTSTHLQWVPGAYDWLSEIAVGRMGSALLTQPL